MPATITRETLGAWLVRCNPRSAEELFAAVREGAARIDRWCVARNYRSALIRTADPILLWVSGNGRTMARGIWGAGHVTGPAVLRGPDGGGCTVPTDISLFDAGISDRELRAAGIGDLEVQRQPMGSNPSWVSRSERERLASLLPSADVERAGYPVAADLGRPVANPLHYGQE